MKLSWIMAASLVAAMAFSPLWLETVPGASDGISNSLVVPASAKPRTVTESLIRTRRDFAGVTALTSGGPPVLVLDLIWGATRDLQLYPAYMEIVGEDGSVIVLDDRESAALLFEDPTAIKGVFMDVGDPSDPQRVWVDELMLGIAEDGSLIRLGMRGADTNGHPIERMASWDDPIAQCACQYMLQCYTAGNCTECKSVAQGCRCKLPATGSDCNQGSICVCPADGFCSTGACTVTGPGTCGCI